MTLNKHKLGEFIYEIYRKNTQNELGIESVRGISNTKQIMATKADVDTSVLHKFYIIKPGEFIYNPRTTRMGEKVGLAFNDTKESLLFSFNNIAFGIKDEAKKTLLPEYLYIYYNRPEFDRYAIKNSWGSATEIFSFKEMCDIELELPSIEIQRKYVAIYKTMVENQKNYEQGLEDLKLTCDAFIEELRRNNDCEEIRNYIEETNERNINLDITDIQGVNSTSEFGETKADTNGLDFHNYKIVHKSDFAYNPSRINLGSIALRRDKECIVSPMYITFKVINANLLLSEYLMMWFSRKEFQRSTLFYATGSVRDTFSFDVMQEVKIPIPDIKIQQDIVKIYKAYILRKEINERLKEQIKNVCSILIKGSLEEAKSN